MPQMIMDMFRLSQPQTRPVLLNDLSPEFLTRVTRLARRLALVEHELLPLGSHIGVAGISLDTKVIYHQ